MKSRSIGIELVWRTAGLLAALILGENTTLADCEGTVNFANRVGTAVTNLLTLERVEVGTNFLAALHYLPDLGVTPTDADFDPATVLLPNAKFAPVPGVFTGGTRITPATTHGGFAWFQVRVWESVFGTNLFASYEDARSARIPFAGRLPLLGRSKIVKVRTGDVCNVPPRVPASLNLPGFSVGTDLLEDQTPPVLNCPGRVDETLAEGQSSRVVTFTVVASDDPNPAPVARCTPSSGSSFPLGATVVTCTAADFSGNRSQCTFPVVVKSGPDTTPPTITCPGTVTVAVPENQVPHVVNFSPTAHDLVDPAPVVSCSPPSGSAFPVGSTLVTCTAVDFSGNQSQCSFTLKLTVTADCSGGTKGGTVNFSNSAATAVTNFVTQRRVEAGTNFLAGLYYWPDTGTVPTSQDFDRGLLLPPAVGFGPVAGVFVGDTRLTPPTTPGGAFAWFQVRVWESVFGTNVFGSFEEAKAAKDPVAGRLPLLGVSSVVRVQTGDPCTVPPGNPSPLGLMTFLVGTPALRDEVPPRVICPGDILATIRPRQAPHVVQFAASAQDDLDPAPVVACTPPSGSLFAEGVTQVTCVARDWNGNTGQCGFTVTVQVEPDTVPPVIVCPANLMVGINTGQVARVVKFAVTATDDLDPAPLVSCAPPSGSLFAVGETRVRCTARDFSSNASQCSFTVTVVEVEDHTPPVLTCVDIVAHTSVASQLVNFAPLVMDDVDLAPEVICDPPSGSRFPLGVTSVTCVARDVVGNSSACGFKVTILIDQGGGGGTVNFGNNSRTSITNGLTGLRMPAGSNFLVGLYYLPDSDITPTDEDFDYGVFVAPPIGFAPVDGLFTGGTRYTPAIPGSPAWFQVRIWERVFGTNRFATFEAARATRTPVGARLPLLSILAPVRVHTGNSAATPPGTPGSLIAGGFVGSAVTNLNVCAAPPAGLVGWWPGDGDLNNLVGSSPGIPSGVKFGSGKAGQAFRFDDARTGIALPATAALQVQDFTIEAWIRRTSTVRVTPDGHGAAYLFACSPGGYGFGLTADGRLFLDQVGGAAVHSLRPVTDSGFHHVAVTKVGGAVAFYLDGAGEAGDVFDPGFVFTGPAAIGARGGDFSNTFWGILDEVSVYHRALSESEVRDLAGANFGKCFVSVPPTFAIEPKSQGVCRGTGVTLSAAAAGSPPLGYLWWFEDAPVAGATNAELRLNEVSASAAGRYWVVVTNAMGAVTSQVATLTVAGGLPVVTLNGDADLVLECHELFVDPGATARDGCGASLPVQVSGTVDPNGVGSYRLTYTAADRWGESGAVTRVVTVLDATPPVLVGCPDPIVVEFVSVDGALVPFTPPRATDLCAGVLPVHCVPPPGSQFSIGTRPVHCTASDPSGNMASCGFTVTVLGARGTGYRVRDQMEAARNSSANSRDQRRLGEAIEHLTAALDAEGWLDDNHLKRKMGQAVFEDIKKTVKLLEELRREKHSAVPDLLVQSLLRRLTEVARLVVVIQLQEVGSAGSDIKQIKQDWEEVRRGDKEAARENHEQAIERYRHAWQRLAKLVVKLTRKAAVTVVQIEFFGTPRETYALETSSDLVTWTTLGVRTAGPDGAVVMEDLVNPGLKQRFYRARLRP